MNGNIETAQPPRDPGKIKMLANEIADIKDRVVNMCVQARNQADNIVGCEPTTAVEASPEPVAAGDLDNAYDQVNRLREAITSLQSQINRFSDL